MQLDNLKVFSTVLYIIFDFIDWFSFVRRTGLECHLVVHSLYAYRLTKHQTYVEVEI